MSIKTRNNTVPVTFTTHGESKKQIVMAVTLVQHVKLIFVKLLKGNRLKFFLYSIDRLIRHRACALRDTAYAIIKEELDEDFEQLCEEIQESRKKRGRKMI